MALRRLKTLPEATVLATKLDTGLGVTAVHEYAAVPTARSFTSSRAAESAFTTCVNRCLKVDLSQGHHSFFAGKCEHVHKGACTEGSQIPERTGLTKQLCKRSQYIMSTTLHA
jgi:hypothetical protein